MPWDLRDRRRPPIHFRPHDVTEPVEKPIEFIRRYVLDGLITNSPCPPSMRQFSPELSTFSYISDMYSSHAYRFLRSHLVFPLENTLRTKYATRIAQLQDDLTDLTRLEKVMADYIAHYASFPEFLLCTLCIDTFTVDPNSPKPRRLVSESRGRRKHGQWRLKGK
jgi:hypothetical protein